MTAHEDNETVLNDLLEALRACLEGHEQDVVLAVVGGLVLETSLRAGYCRQEVAEQIVRNLTEEVLGQLAAQAPRIAQLRQGGLN